MKSKSILAYFLDIIYFVIFMYFIRDLNKSFVDNNHFIIFFVIICVIYFIFMDLTYLNRGFGKVIFKQIVLNEVNKIDYKKILL